MFGLIVLNTILDIRRVCVLLVACFVFGICLLSVLFVLRIRCGFIYFVF